MSLENPQSKRERKDSPSPEKAPSTSHSPDHYLVREIHDPSDDLETEKKIDEIEERLRRMSIEKSVESAVKQHLPIPLDPKLEEKMIKVERVKRIATNVTDFVPVIGSIKMMLEGTRGVQYGTGKKLPFLTRLIHGTSGAVFLALDITGVGVIASELGKLGIKIGLRALEKRTLTKVIESAVIKKEGAKLVARGEKRIDKKEKLAAA